MSRSVAPSIECSQTARKSTRNEAPGTQLLLDEFDAEPVPGLLNRRLRARILLWSGTDRRWPSHWMGQHESGEVGTLAAAARHNPHGQTGHGLQLAFEGIDPDQIGSGRLESLEDCQLWLPQSAVANALSQAPELFARVLDNGGRLVCVAPDAQDSGVWRLRALEPAARTNAPMQALTATVPQLLHADLLAVLPRAQRFQGKVALTVEAATACNRQWQDALSARRSGPMIAGATIHAKLAEMLGPTSAGMVLGALVGAVRSRNSLDNRLRNMANERLALLLLVAVARLGERARAFTVREICRELGAVATGT